MRQWRLLTDPPAPGAYNMAVDEAILLSVARGDAPPTLRLYAWEPACLSLGYGQKTTDVDFDRLAQCGWHVVRRPTGGRAILHADELTYSLALPLSHPIAAGGIADSYRRISQALVAGLRRLGVEPHADMRAERTTFSGPVCFQIPSHYEITVAGRKLVGSAQMRRQGGLLQHGALPLYGDIGRICDVLAYPDEDSRHQAKAQVRARATTLAEALGTNNVSWSQVADAIAWGFSTAFPITLFIGALTQQEQDQAAALAATVYGHLHRRGRFRT